MNQDSIFLILATAIFFNMSLSDGAFVDSCPQGESEWKNQSAKYGCIQSEGQYYHCLKTLNSTFFESCFNSVGIHTKDGCAVFDIDNTTSKIKLSLVYEDCNASYGCPNQNQHAYLSNEIYKYPSCIDQFIKGSISFSTGFVRTGTAKSKPGTFSTVSETDERISKSSFLNYTSVSIIGGGVVFVVIIVGLICLVLIQCKRINQFKSQIERATYMPSVPYNSHVTHIYNQDTVVYDYVDDADMKDYDENKSDNGRLKRRKVSDLESDAYIDQKHFELSSIESSRNDGDIDEKTLMSCVKGTVDDTYLEPYVGLLPQGGNMQMDIDTNDGKNDAIIYAFEKRAKEILNNHDQSTPLFLYLPFQNVHDPIQVPKQYEDMYPNIKSDGRRKFSGMVSALDEAIGNITNRIKELGMYENTLFAFTADNGGWIQYFGNNYPLRGGKFTIYEGGTRVIAFMTGAGLKKGTQYDGIMHAVDWSATLVDAAGGAPPTDGDGMSQWKAISGTAEPPRNELVYNYDQHLNPVQGHAAIRIGDWKLVDGYPGQYPDWYKPDTVYDLPDFNKPEKYFRDYIKMNKSRYQLYNLKDDPTEHNDLSKQYLDKVRELSARLNELTKSAVKPNYPDIPDPKSLPSRFGGAWSPGWC